MHTTNRKSHTRSKIDASSTDREAILDALEEYRTLLHEPLPAAEVNERVLQAKIDDLLDRLYGLR